MERKFVNFCVTLCDVTVSSFPNILLDVFLLAVLPMENENEEVPAVVSYL